MGLGQIGWVPVAPPHTLVEPGAVVATGKLQVDSDHDDLIGINVGIVLIQ